MATIPPAPWALWRCGRRTRSRTVMSRIQGRWFMLDRKFCVSLGVALGGVVLAYPASAADAAHGKQLFAACIACHSETADAQGPSLKGVAGRKAAALEDFHYSSAMKRSEIVWDTANLRDHLHDPQAKVK